MPYQYGKRLPGERASRLGHLEVLKSKLVNELISSFESSSFDEIDMSIPWQNISSLSEPLRIIFGIDGSMQPLQSESPPYKKIAFIKTALLRIDQFALSKIDKSFPHPFILKDILSDSALYHSTVFPLINVTIPNLNTYHAIRQIIFESMKDDSLDGEPLETLKWIVYEKWQNDKKQLPLFDCPHCEKQIATLPHNAETGKCPGCGKQLFLTDMLGFHQEMTSESAPETIATTYMNIHETLLLFTGIRLYWENNRDILKNCLFVKDGPLTIRAQYSKIVNPIRRFLEYSNNLGYPIHLISQEKSGRFYNYLELIGKNAPDNSIFIPTNNYIKEKIQQRPNTGAPYGKDTNYGAKIFIKLNDYHKMVLNIPTGKFLKDPKFENLIGAEKIFATLPTILSNKYEGALLPIELANGIASLSTYPSAHILKIFSDSKCL